MGYCQYLPLMWDIHARRSKQALQIITAYQASHTKLLSTDRKLDYGSTVSKLVMEIMTYGEFGHVLLNEVHIVEHR